MAEPSNVIKFPKPSKPRPKPRPTLFVQPGSKSLLCGAVVCLLVGSVWWNARLQTGDKVDASRQVQLVMGSEVEDNKKPFQRQLASLSFNQSREKLVRRQLAAKNETVLGRRPSSIDKLKFGFLAGHYALEYTGASSTFVKSFRFVKKAGVFPILVEDRKSFLNQYAHLWPVKFDKIISLKRNLDGEVLHETYGLQHEGLQIAKVQLELDRLEHLLRLNIEH